MITCSTVAGSDNRQIMESKKMKKVILAVALVAFSGSALAHGWFFEGQRITSYAGSTQGYATPISNDRSYADKIACEAFATEQRAVNSFRDGNGRSMVSVVVGGCHQAPIIIRYQE